MTLWIILGSIAALLTLALALSVTVILDVAGGKPTVRLTYGLIRSTLYPRKPGRVKKAKKRKPPAPKRAQAQKPKPEKKKKLGLSQLWEIIQELLPSTGKAMRKLLNGIVIDHLVIDFDIADEDAAQAAIRYGQVSAAVWNAIAFLSAYFTLSVERVQIDCLFNQAQSRYDGRAVLKVRAFTLLALTHGMFWAIIGILIHNKTRKKSGARASAQG